MSVESDDGRAADTDGTALSGGGGKKTLDPSTQHLSLAENGRNATSFFFSILSV